MANGSAMVESSLNTFSGQMRSLAVYGDFMVAATGSIPDATLSFFELATPRSLHQLAAGAGGGSFAEVGPGFLYSGNGRVHDLDNNNNSLAATAALIDLPGAGSDDFLYDMVRMGDTMVTAQGGGFVLYDVSDANDRNGGTLYDINDTTTVMHWSAGTRVTGVEAWGNYLVVVEVRPTGVWLEVYDARPILNPGMGVTFNASTHWRASSWCCPSRHRRPRCGPT